jgi:hypothetical protein
MDVENSSNHSNHSNDSKSKSKRDNISEDLSMSELDLLANRKKVNKENMAVNVEDIISNDLSTKKSSRKRVPKDSTKSNSSTSADSTSEDHHKAKKVSKENKDDSIRREKSTLLYKINLLNTKKVVSHIKLDMNNSLEEIKNEFERVRTTLENEKMVKFCKQMLLMGVQGVEMMNTRFDPLGVDLDGWSEAMGYSMENQEYDEVLSELYEKYKGAGSMSPEIKLVLMIAGSAAMFTITKKLTKMEPSGDFLGNILGNFVSTPNVQAQAQQQAMQAQMQQQAMQAQMQQAMQQQAMLQQQAMQAQAMQQQPMQTQYTRQQQYIPNANSLAGVSPSQIALDNLSDASSDVPSKIKNGPASIDLENIIRTMNEKKQQKNVTSILDSDNEDEEKQIKTPVKKAVRARKPRAAARA